MSTEIVVPEKVVEQLKQIRDSAEFNMVMDAQEVLLKANELNMYETVTFLANDRGYVDAKRYVAALNAVANRD